MYAILQAAAAQAAAGPGHGGGHQIHSEADLVLPNLHTGVPEGAHGAVKFLGMSGWSILAVGLVVCAIAIAFGMTI
jgi:hypothetical protein